MQDAFAQLMTLIVILVLMALAVVIYFLPTIIAYKRRHKYVWVIFGINFICGLTGLGYLVAFVWSVWPSQTAFYDVVLNDPTSNSPEAGQKIYGQLGANIRAFRDARDGNRANSTPISPGVSPVTPMRDPVPRLPSTVQKTTSPKLYVYIGQEVRGPYVTGQIHAMIKTGDIGPATLACREGTTSWIPLSHLI